MTQNRKPFSDIDSVQTSAPCRIDMGGTLDMTTFHYPLGYLSPCTFNIAINLRTNIKINPYKQGMVKVTSKGFEPAEFPAKELPFRHPLGLVFAISAYFEADGVHIDIESTSPPKSALGGSSVAAVALTAGFLQIKEPELTLAEIRKKAAGIAFFIESSIAGSTCGIQDHLAASYGGINAWYFDKKEIAPSYRKETVVKEDGYKPIKDRLLMAYCGVPHVSENVNSIWIDQFLSGKTRNEWIEIVDCTHRFVLAMREGRFSDSYPLMNRETEIRRDMTPDVLDEIGNKLVDSAIGAGCGTRFTGAGGGGCIWALGEPDTLSDLKKNWESILSLRDEASFLEAEIDPNGVLVD